MKKVSGVITALVTPFQKGEIDYGSLDKLIDFQLKEGVDGFVVHGTTGESPTLNDNEKKSIFDFVRKKVPPDFPLIVGAGSNSTVEAVKNCQTAEQWGAKALLVVSPYYNRPPQRGLVAHFTAIADAVNVPIFLYNVPSRTITPLDPDTVVELSRHQRILGIKDASGNLTTLRAMQETCRPDFIFLSGDDGTSEDFQRRGGHGVVSVVSNIIPNAMKKREAKKFRDLIELMICEINPIPVKAALQMLGIIASAECRLPLVELTPIWKEKLESEMRVHGLVR